MANIVDNNDAKPDTLLEVIIGRCRDETIAYRAEQNKIRKREENELKETLKQAEETYKKEQTWANWQTVDAAQLDLKAFEEARLKIQLQQQRARWIIDGDKPNSWYLSLIKSRASANAIPILRKQATNEQGEPLRDEDGKPVVARRITPIDVGGLKVISIGFLVPPDKAVIWRGPMLHGSITSFLRDTDWGPLDYLVIDMPPGTGDVALTLSQTLPPTGAVIVCTPQDVALLDAVKAIRMFQEVRIPVLGIVENMSYFLCPDNGKRYDIFGNGGAKRKADEFGIPFLGEVPINIQLRVNGDEGKTGANFDISEVSSPLENMCTKLVRQIASKHQEEPPLPSLSVL